MKKVFLIIFLIGLTALIFLSNIRQFQEGTIKKIQSGELKTTIEIEELNTSLIIFEKLSNLKAGDKIKFIGDEDTYKGKPQILVQEIILSND